MNYWNHYSRVYSRLESCTAGLQYNSKPAGVSHLLSTTSALSKHLCMFGVSVLKITTFTAGEETTATFK